MTLTEEQRAALKRVVAYMDEMYAIASPYHGCTEDADLLRAMIDSSGTVEPVGGFDLEKARAMICHYRIENPGDADTDCGLEDLIRQANLAEEALDEIERLNAHINSACIESLRIAEEQAAEIERLRGEMENYGDDYVCQMKSKDARIQELEDALVEERARALWFEGDDPCDPPNLDWKTKPNDIPESVRLLWGESARQQLQAEGKIGPDARPKCDHAWQAAIEERGYQTCLKCGECRNIEDIPRTAPAWQITEERKAALWHAINVLKENDIMEEPEGHLWDEEVTVLQAMLTEAGQ